MTSEVSEVEPPSPPPEIPAGRLVVQFLQEKETGATATEILQYLREATKDESANLEKVVDSILENGTALGFLERKGSQYLNWVSRTTSGRKRRARSCGRRGRRTIRKRSCRCRARRRRR